LIVVDSIDYEKLIAGRKVLRRRDKLAAKGFSQIPLEVLVTTSIPYCCLPSLHPHLALLAFIPSRVYLPYRNFFTLHLHGNIQLSRLPHNPEKLQQQMKQHLPTPRPFPSHLLRRAHLIPKTPVFTKFFTGHVPDTLFTMMQVEDSRRVTQEALVIVDDSWMNIRDDLFIHLSNRK
jgi:hypothetical protein